MKLLVVLCACAALASVSAGNVRERRFLDSVSSFFSHAVDTVKDGVETAAHAVADTAESAAHKVADTAETAAHAVAGAAQTAAHAVAGAAETAVDAIGDAVHTAYTEVSEFASKATAVLGPILDQVAQTAGPIAKSLLDAAVQQLIQQAPEILSTLGQAGLQELATTILTSAGKRDVSDVDALKEVFSHLVQEGMNVTVAQVHTVVAAVDKFNAVLGREVNALEKAIQSGEDVRAAATTFYARTLAALQPLIASGAFNMDVSQFDSIIPQAIQRFHQVLQGALHHSAQKRGLLLNLMQDGLNLVHDAEQQLGQLVSTVEHLAQGLLAPTVENAKHVAQTLLDNAGTLTSDLLAKALPLLAPFQQQLGPIFQQVQTLAGSLGLSL